MSDKIQELEAEALDAIRGLIRQGDIPENLIRSKLTFRQAEVILNPQFVFHPGDTITWSDGER